MNARQIMLPLLDRQAELEVLARSVDATAAGEGRVVLVEGGPGAGKTRLLGEARTLAVQAGLRVLSARGGEIEREYPYGGVRQLFEAALLGPGSASWLEGPAAAASSVFKPEAAVDAAAFATLNGLYWVTANAASERPLVLVVDDLHWVDRPSLGFLQFLVRRLEGVPVLLVAAGRPAEPDVLIDIAASALAEVLRPAPLTMAGAAQLAQGLLGVRPAERFTEACRHVTGGNPLLLVELLRALRAEHIVPDEAHVDAVDQVGPSAVSRVVLVRLRRLSRDAVAVAQALAVLGTGAESSLLAEVAEVDEAAVTRAIESLIEVEVLDAQPPLNFVHPIVRDAIYRELAPAERDRRHVRAAELLRRRAAGLEQVGAHLMMAAPRGLGWVAEALQLAAADALRRGAVESAVTFLRRAVAERPGDADPALLFRLGMTEAVIDPRSAVEHLRAARHASADQRFRVRIGEMITRILVFFDPGQGVEAVRETQADLPADAGDLGAALWAMARYAGRFSSVAAEEPPAVVPDSPRGRMLRAVQTWDLALSGGTARECAARAADVLGLSDAPEKRRALTHDTIFTAMVAGSVLILADDPRAQSFWDDWYLEAVRAGRAHAVIAAAVWNGLMRFRFGRLADAETTIRAAMEGPRDWGPGTERVPAHTLATLAEVLIERGDLAGARAALDRIPDRRSPDSEGALLSRCVELRLLALSGRHQEVLEAVDGAAYRLRTVANPAWAPWRSLRADALAHLGRTEEAIATATEELELARHWGTPGPIGRALVLVGELEGRLERLEEAVETTRDPFARLEHAKALFALGRAVRRSGRPRDARAHLRDAHQLATRCDAGALARRAGDELAAAGGRPRPIAGSGASSLTPSERRVAELATAGLPNREIAQQLFLSPKTVEVHLSSTYQKLGIRNRGALLSTLEPPARPGPDGSSDP